MQHFSYKIEKAQEVLRWCVEELLTNNFYRRPLHFTEVYCIMQSKECRQLFVIIFEGLLNLYHILHKLVNGCMVKYMSLDRLKMQGHVTEQKRLLKYIGGFFEASISCAVP